MKTMKLRLLLLCALAHIIVLATSCMNDFLDLKRDKSQVIPISLEDFFSVLENEEMNSFSTHQLGELGSDDFYLLSDQWNALSSPIEKNGYIWAENIFQDESSTDWNRGYEKILYANFVLEGVQDIEETAENKNFRNKLIGTSHFYRGTNFFHLAQLFCKSYDLQTANTDLGLPLRITSNINKKYNRATLADTYDLIISDLLLASHLLPDEMTLNTRPYKGAAFGMLASVFLQMSDYNSALKYADAALALAPDILDYNELDITVNYPFPLNGQGNSEILFYSQMTILLALFNTNMNVDSVLLNTYHEDDLRKGAFFFLNNGRNVFKGTYSGSFATLFTGLTTSEMILIRAECNARLGNLDEAINDLNKLLSNRFTHKGFIAIEKNTSQDELLRCIVSERRKELVYRGRRWPDLKRYAKNAELEQSLKRNLNERSYTLPINSPRWVWPIPPDVITLGGLEQNDR